MTGHNRIKKYTISKYFKDKLKTVCDNKAIYKRYLLLLAPNFFLFVLYFKYNNSDFLIFIPIIIAIEFLLSKMEEFSYKFVITLFATGFGVFLALFVNREGIKDRDTERTIKYLEIGALDLIDNILLVDTLKQIILLDTSKLTKEYFRAIHINPPNMYHLTSSNDVSLKYISVYTRIQLLHLNTHLDSELKIINDSSSSFKLKASNMIDYEMTLIALWNYLTTEISFLREKFSEDSLKKSIHFITAEYKNEFVKMKTDTTLKKKTIWQFGY